MAYFLFIFLLLLGCSDNEDTDSVNNSLTETCIQQGATVGRQFNILSYISHIGINYTSGMQS